MDIRSLACFVAIAEDLHFRKAAQKLHMTQPTLTQRIQILEREVGTPLFARDRRGVALTPAGQAFLAPAKAAIFNAQLATESALRAVRGDLGRLRLGFTVIAFYGALPNAVRGFRSRYPDVTVELVEMNSPSLEMALAAGDLDIGILHPPISTPGLTMHALPDQPFVLALPSNHRLAKKAVVRIADLQDEPLLAAPRAIGPNIFDRVITLFHNQRVTPRIVQEVTPMTTLVGLVAAGVGLGFVTEGIATVKRPGVVFRPVTPKPPSLPLAAAWRGSALSPTGQAFLKIVADMG